MTKVVCPGSFNPVTLGHINVFERCARLFDEVVVLVVHNAAKTYHVSAQQRAEWIKRAVAHLPNVSVDAYSGLLVDYAASCGANLLVKGVRDALDTIDGLELPSGKITMDPTTRNPIKGGVIMQYDAEGVTHYVSSVNP